MNKYARVLKCLDVIPHGSRMESAPFTMGWLAERMGASAEAVRKACDDFGESHRDGSPGHKLVPRDDGRFTLRAITCQAHSADTTSEGPGVPNRETAITARPFTAEIIYPEATRTLVTSQLERDEQLRSFWRANGIAADEANFHCAYFNECRACYPREDSYKTAKETYVGEEYTKPRQPGGPPQLLFISSNASKLDDMPWEADKYSLAGIRAWQATRRMDDEPRGWYWRTVHEVALELLSSFDQTRFTSLDSVKPHFANMNSVRCMPSYPNKKEGNVRGTLFRNCRGFMQGEVEILAPDIVVTLGRKASWSFQCGFGHAVQRSETPLPVLPQLRILHIRNRKVAWLDFVHPRARGDAFNKKVRPNLSAYAAFIRKEF